MGISGFYYFMSFIREVLIKQASNCLSNDIHCTPVSGSFLVQNLSSWCWVVLIGFCHQPQSGVHTSLLYGKLLVPALHFLTCHYKLINSFRLPGIIYCFKLTTCNLLRWSHRFPFSMFSQQWLKDKFACLLVYSTRQGKHSPVRHNIHSHNILR